MGQGLTFRRFELLFPITPPLYQLKLSCFMFLSKSFSKTPDLPSSFHFSDTFMFPFFVAAAHQTGFIGWELVLHLQWWSVWLSRFETNNNSSRDTATHWGGFHTDTDLFSQRHESLSHIDTQQGFDTDTDTDLFSQRHVLLSCSQFVWEHSLFLQFAS